MKPVVAAEFREPSQLLDAVRALRAEGHDGLEVYTPYPVHGVDEALGARPSRLPRLVFVIGIAAAAGAYWLQWLLNAALYPLNVGTRPAHFPLSYVPITFEMGVLFAALTCFVGVLAFGKLLRLWHPVFELDGFESASQSTFWLAVWPGRRELDLVALRSTLERHGAAHIHAGGNA